jgi:glutamine cyclotransferase
VGYLFDKITFRKGKELNKFKVNQGICCDDKYIYSVFERKKPHGCKIRKFTFKNETIKISKVLDIGHGNDITCKGNTLYITHSAGKSVIHTVNKNTLKKGKDIKISIPSKIKKNPQFNGIAAMPNGFALRLIGSNRIIIVDNKFNYVRNFKLSEIPKLQTQGIEYHDNKIYRVYSNFQKSNNNVYAYDMNGKLVKKYKVKVKGEAEGIFFHSKKFYMSIYRKYKVNKKKVFKSWLYCLEKVK